MVSWNGEDGSLEPFDLLDFSLLQVIHVDMDAICASLELLDSCSR